MAGVTVVYYSRTGTTRAVARDVFEQVQAADLLRIRPRCRRSYPNWLARSFVPGSTVRISQIRTDFREADAVFIGSPKWTLSCPPVTTFLRAAEFADTPAGVFLTYGGFDEERYARRLVQQVERRGADVRGTLLVQRDELDGTAYDDRLREFCDDVLPGESPVGGSR